MKQAEQKKLYFEFSSKMSDEEREEVEHKLCFGDSSPKVVMGDGGVRGY